MFMQVVVGFSVSNFSPGQSLTGTISFITSSWSFCRTDCLIRVLSSEFKVLQAEAAMRSQFYLLHMTVMDDV